jgi:hypothetical protein
MERPDQSSLSRREIRGENGRLRFASRGGERAERASLPDRRDAALLERAQAPPAEAVDDLVLEAVIQVVFLTTVYLPKKLNLRTDPKSIVKLN